MKIVSRKNNWQICFLILALLLLTQWCCARAVDSTYIGFYKEDFTAKFYFGNKTTGLSVSESGRDTDYRPNTPVAIGLGLTWRGFGGSIAYGFDFMRDKEKGRSEALDLQYYYYGRSFTFNLFLTDYSGFYIEKDRENEAVDFFPDLRITRVGGTFQYVFNHHRFSYRAAFGYNEKQLRSAGSLLLGAGFYYIKADLTGTDLYNNFTLRNNYMAGPNIGYAYSWVKKRVTVCPSVAAGANFGLDGINESFRVYPAFLAGLSGAYRHKSWTIGVSCIFDMVLMPFGEKNELAFNAADMKVLFIKRFDWRKADRF